MIKLSHYVHIIRSFKATYERTLSRIEAPHEKARFEAYSSVCEQAIAILESETELQAAIKAQLDKSSGHALEMWEAIFEALSVTYTPNYRVYVNSELRLETPSLAKALPVYSEALHTRAIIHLDHGERTLIHGDELANATHEEKAMIQTWFRDQIGISIHG